MSNPIKNISEYILIIGFALILLFPFTDQFIGLSKQIDLGENRALKSKPEFDINNLDQYTKEFDAYYSDNFIGRNLFIKLYNNFEFFALDISPQKKVVKGKDGWLYLKSTANNYSGVILFDDYELYRIKEELKYRQQWCKQRGIAFYLVVLPDKTSIYPEYLPNYIVKKNPINRTEQLLKVLKEGNINVINLIKELSLIQSDTIIFQKTDDHWNFLGSYYGYKGIMTRLKEDFPVLNYSLKSDFNFNIIPYDRGNLALMLGVEKQYKEAYIDFDRKVKTRSTKGKKNNYKAPENFAFAKNYEIVKETKGQNDINCLIFRDSYAKYLIPYLQEDFNKTVFIFDQWKYRLDKEIIENEDPDILLYAIVETKLKKLSFNPSFYIVDDFGYRILHNETSLQKIKTRVRENNLDFEEEIMRVSLGYFNKKPEDKKALNRSYFEYKIRLDKVEMQKLRSESENTNSSIDSLIIYKANERLLRDTSAYYKIYE